MEATAVLRKRWIANALTEDRFEAAIDDLAALPLKRYPALPLLRRAFELRASVTAYGAVYVALAGDIAVLDEVAALAASDDLDAIRRRFGSDDRLNVPQDITSYTGGEPVEVRPAC